MFCGCVEPNSEKRTSFVLNRAGVAGAVLQTPLSLIYSLIHWVILAFRIFKTLSISNCKGWEAEILRECSPPTMCHMSRVKCHVSAHMDKRQFFLHMQGLSKQLFHPKKCVKCKKSEFATKQQKCIWQQVLEKENCNTPVEATSMELI